jgi:DeoR family ulaG and ulaABCDEF operon transcriptional repressor
MHATERERLILATLAPNGFVTYRDLEARLGASPATIRRDLAKLESDGRIVRVHGGARLAEAEGEQRQAGQNLAGTPFELAITRNLPAKQAIGRAAAALCQVGQAVMIDGGTTTLQMCPYLAGLDLQVLTNSLHIVDALLPQPGTRILVPSGTVFREQNIILAPAGEDSMPRFHAPRLFMGAAAGRDSRCGRTPVAGARRRSDPVGRFIEIRIVVGRDCVWTGRSGYVDYGCWRNRRRRRDGARRRGAPGNRGLTARCSIGPSSRR